jgi:hypothetical protein
MGGLKVPFVQVALLSQYTKDAHIIRTENNYRDTRFFMVRKLLEKSEFIKVLFMHYS